jgi:uncharacterized membrane protein YeiH
VAAFIMETVFNCEKIVITIYTSICVILVASHVMEPLRKYFLYMAAVADVMFATVNTKTQA